MNEKNNAQRLLSGSVLRVVALITGMLVSFYVMPFLVHTLGDRWYGFWALAGSIVGYYTILDLGLTVAAHRFLAIAYARQDKSEASRVFTTAFALFGCAGAVALVLTLCMWLGAPLFVQPVDLATIRLLVLLLGTSFALGFPVAVFHGVLAADLRYDLSSYLQLGKLVVRTVLVLYFLRQVPSVVALGVITLGTELLGDIVTAWTALRLWPWLKVTRQNIDRSRIRTFFNFGLSAFLIRVGDLVRFGVDGLVVARFLGVAAVTHYSIAMRLTEYFQNLLTQSLGVLMPVYSRYHGLDERETLIARVRQGSRLSVAVSASVAGGIAIFGFAFISRWMGTRYLDAYWPLVLLTAATMTAVMQTPSTSYLVAIDRHKYYAWLNAADAVANLVLSIILVRRFGMLGVALGTVIPTLVVKLYLQPRYVCAQLGISLVSYWVELGTVLLKSLVAQAPIAAAVWMVRPQSYGAIFALAATFYALYSAILYRFILGSEDQQVLSSAFPALQLIASASPGRDAAREGRVP